MEKYSEMQTVSTESAIGSDETKRFMIRKILCSQAQFGQRNNVFYSYSARLGSGIYCWMQNRPRLASCVSVVGFLANYAYMGGCSSGPLLLHLFASLAMCRSDLYNDECNFTLDHG